MAKTVKVNTPWSRVKEQPLDIEEVSDIQFANIRIVEGQRPGKIEIYLVDEEGEVQEGGEFELNDFLDHILIFYKRNF